MLQKDYFETLAERKKQSRVSRNFQHTGLIISQLLNDEKHKALYIKLAKAIPTQRLMELAKDVAQRKEVVRPGAYFMKLARERGILASIPKSLWSKKKIKKSGQSGTSPKRLF